MTRKRRLTRSRRDRRRVFARTRQTLEQKFKRVLEVECEAVANPPVHPLVALYRREAMR